MASGDGSVGDEGRLVGDHVIRCARIGNKETCARPKLVGHECNGVRQRVVEKGNDKLWKLHCADPFGLMGDVEWRQLVVAGGKSGLKMLIEA